MNTFSKLLAYVQDKYDNLSNICVYKKEKHQEKAILHIHPEGRLHINTRAHGPVQNFCIMHSE